MKKDLSQKLSKKRSLKHRVKKTMYLSNFISVLLFSVVLLFIIGLLINVLGNSFSNYTANQMAYNIKDVMASNNSYELNQYFQEMNPKDAVFFTFNSKKINNFNNRNEINSSVHQLFNKTIGGFNINAIEFRVWKDNQLIYSSLGPQEERLIQNSIITDLFSNEVLKDIIDSDGNVIGQIGVRINPFILISLFVVIILSAILLLIINSISTRIFTKILSTIVTKPLSKLNHELGRIATGDIENELHESLKIKKSVYEVQSLINSTNKIMEKMNDYVHQLTNQKDELEAQATELEAQTEELEAQRDEFEAQNNTLEEHSKSLKNMNSAYINRTLKLQTLLNNVGQGFLTIGRDQIINPEYSYECEKLILSSSVNKISNMKITDTLFADSDQKDFIHDLIDKIFNCPEKQKELYLSLLPEEILLNDKILKIEYKLANDEQLEKILLIILTDITHTRNLEKQMDEERNNLKMIVKVLLSRQEVIDLISEYYEFAKNDFKEISPEQKEEFLREIHTYKGIFSQYYLENISKYLNELEDLIYNDDGMDYIYQLNYSKLTASLDIDVKTIESYIGSEFLYSDEIYTIKEEKIINIENIIKSILPHSEFIKVLPVIKSLRYKSIKELLNTYTDYTIKLSERLCKPIYPFSIQGDDIYVDPLTYQPFLKSLVHIFRNCIDHGIETEDERIELNKPQFGEINCKINKLTKGFEIVISDDGYGINPDDLVANAVKKNIISENDIDKTDTTDIIDLIFIDGMTTRECVSPISGRGVGLAAVKEAVERLNGTVSVSTIINKGTEFKIWLPDYQGIPANLTAPEELLKQITQVTNDIFTELGLEICDYELIKTDKIVLNNISALISIKGYIDAILIISINDTLGKRLVKSFMVEDIKDTQIESYIEDVLGEISNTILGNALGRFEEDGIFLSIGIPAIISNKEAYIKYSGSQIYSVVDKKCNSSLTVSLLPLDPELSFIDEI